MGSTNRTVVERSWGLIHETPSRKDEFYGPNFTFAEYFKPRNYFHGVVVHLFLSIGVALLAFVPPVRALLKKLVYQPGEGADREEIRKDVLEYRGVAYPDSDEYPGKQAYCQSHFRGGIYYRKYTF